MSNNLSRLPLLAPLTMIFIAAGCAGRTAPAPTSTHRASPPPVTYADIRPDDLIPQEYRVHPGDVLQVSVTDLVGPGVETQKSLRVNADGKISLPLIGQVHVAGLTEEEVNLVICKIYRASVCW
jgi:protein involved in polysaccharide export with SLBB domain